MSPGKEPLLLARGIQKRFGGVRALVNGEVDIRAGEVHAIMGENGAGKSTLGKIIAGVFPADAGELQLDGKAFRPANPQESQGRGVAMIFQELDLFPNLTVGENIVAGNLAFPESWRVRRSAIAAFARPHLDAVGFTGGVHDEVGDLSIGQQQLVAVARALSMSARLVVMDESTSALTGEAVAVLFGVVRRLKEMGVAVVMVTHKMDEIFAICDRVTVLRDGLTVGTHVVAEVSSRQLIEEMVGREFAAGGRRTRPNDGDVLLAWETVTTAALTDISFVLRRGEILGLAGLVGSGRTEVGRALMGLDPITSGCMKLRGVPYRPRSVRAARKSRVGMVPEDRKRQGLMMQMAVRENATLSILSRLSRAGFLRRRQEARLDEEIAQRTRLKADHPMEPVMNLSGGNQQKVLFARWLMVETDVLFLDDPTRGVDVGAKEDIYDLMDSASKEGKGILMVSSELPELLRCCDRILVLREGRLVGEVDAQTTSQEEIMEVAAGVVT